MNSNDKKSESLITVTYLENIFKDAPGNKTITFKGKCSDCGCRVTIDITSVSGGYGLQGGALFENISGECFARCSACYDRVLDHYVPPARTVRSKG